MSYSHVIFHYLVMNVYLFGSLHKMTNNNINEDETITNVQSAENITNTRNAQTGKT